MGKVGTSRLLTRRHRKSDGLSLVIKKVYYLCGMGQMVKTVCARCNKEFLKKKAEYERTERNKRRHFCSLYCVVQGNEANFGSKANRDTTHLKGIVRTDEYSPFREYLRRARRRGLECDISLEYLKKIWDYQEGKCVYSQVQLIHPKLKGKNSPIYTASLDRKDSSLGYIEGNIQFVSIAMNLMKNSMSDFEVIELIRVLKN